MAERNLDFDTAVDRRMYSLKYDLQKKEIKTYYLWVWIWILISYIQDAIQNRQNYGIFGYMM